MKFGYLNLVLHAHLPFVHHPEHNHFFEENWFFEALTESYLPLVNMLERLQIEQIDYRLTLSISPTLISLLQNSLLQTRYARYLQRLIELANKETERTQSNPDLNRLAFYYRDLLKQRQYEYFVRYQGDLLAALKKHQAGGNLNLITTAATHGYLPLLSHNPSAVHCQLETGTALFRTTFNQPVEGFWLPECAYYPDLEQELKQAGIRYFFTDSHAITEANDSTPHSVHAPLDCGNGVMAFGRDPLCSEQVWSSDHGYPGDPDYREFYKDIGFELDLDDLAPYIDNDQTRCDTGIKYHRIGQTEDNKPLYDPALAIAKARQHARHFIDQRREQIRTQGETHRLPPMITAPYDAELFGHWWFEGPIWLEEVIRLTAADDLLHLQTAAGYLAQHPVHPVATPAASSWGADGYSTYWLNDSNDWIYPLLHQAASDLEQLTADLNGLLITELQRRAGNQALRSLLLAQASDWPFLMKSGTASDYASKRLTDQLARFNYLLDSIRKNRIDERYLCALEIMDSIFPDIDFRTFTGLSG